MAVVLSGALDDGHAAWPRSMPPGGFMMVLEPGKKPRGMQRNAIEYDVQISNIWSAAVTETAIEHAISLAG